MPFAHLRALSYILPAVIRPCTAPRCIQTTLSALACAATLAGCAGSPTIKGIKAERTAESAEAIQMLITLELTNSGDGPVELTEWEYSAAVNGRTVYHGSWVASLTLPAKTPMTTDLPVVVQVADAQGLTDAEWTISGSVGYRATQQMDRLLYQLGFNRLYAGFDARGKGIGVAAPPPPPRTTVPQP